MKELNEIIPGIDADLRTGMLSEYNKQTIWQDTTLQKRLEQIRRIAAMP